LSGSTLSRLFKKDTRYPVGRVLRLTITPFTFSEFLIALKAIHLVEVLKNFEKRPSETRHNKLLEWYNQYLTVGGLPAVVIAYVRKKDYTELLAEIIADYNQDFIRLFGKEHLAIVQACFKSVANFVGTPSKNTTVIPSPSTAVNHKINEIFARLEEWKFILRSAQRGVSPQQSHNYLPKRYLFDTGILKHLRETAIPNINMLAKTAPEVRNILGGIFENQIAIELNRAGYELTGWKRTPSGSEIDFIVKTRNKLFPLEVKAALKVKGTHLKGLLEYLKLYKLKTGFVISGAPFEIMNYREGMKIINLPIYMAEKLDEVITKYGD